MASCQNRSVLLAPYPMACKSLLIPRNGSQCAHYGLSLSLFGQRSPVAADSDQPGPGPSVTALPSGSLENYFPQPMVNPEATAPYQSPGIMSNMDHPARLGEPNLREINLTGVQQLDNSHIHQPTRRSPLLLPQ